MARENVTLAILFADIAGSTRIYESIGDRKAQRLIGDCLSILSKAALDHKGTIIKTIGDEIMCTFPNADNAVEAAVDMNMRLIDMAVINIPEGVPPNIYIGIQMGSVIKEDADVFGDAVNVAASMVALAKQRQIITTEETILTLKPDFRETARCIDKVTIKGKTRETNIYEIMWEQKDQTVMIDTTLGCLGIDSNLELRTGDQIIEAGKDRAVVTLGRQPHNDLVINDIRVSRTHARIEYRRGKFILIDQSTNGTYTQIQGEKELKLKRDETAISGDGVICLGQEVDGGQSDGKILVHFRLKSPLM